MWEEETEQGREPAIGLNPAGGGRSRSPLLSSRSRAAPGRCDFPRTVQQAAGLHSGAGKWPQGEVRVGPEGSPAARRAASPATWGSVCGRHWSGGAGVISSMSHLRRVPGPPTEPVVNSPSGGRIVTHERLRPCWLGLGEPC